MGQFRWGPRDTISAAGLGQPVIRTGELARTLGQLGIVVAAIQIVYLLTVRRRSRSKAENCGSRHNRTKECMLCLRKCIGVCARIEENAMSIPIQSRFAFGKRFGLAPDAIFRLWKSALKDDESLIDEAIAATYDRMISIHPVRAEQVMSLIIRRHADQVATVWLPARTFRLGMLLVPQDETFRWCNLSTRPASLCAGLLPASPLRHLAASRFGCLRKPGITARNGSG